ncbi:TIGR01548 family HAD-type hydrolase [Stenomitos frigidus]|uniref:TIGR01548 family HAD-type hydrolase n=1 Tax=Stenomitos frigidus ULC18 TaxID=2107698 RepID=A0A2T1EAA1_9CYAN|nr:TIGR01548 family HAD-type hydrolase [Stenomitos frigidus]PSB29644.1 TIGR01548 family HAD-type hydrolase [Stenomitos frigidus ULC18]
MKSAAQVEQAGVLCVNEGLDAIVIFDIDGVIRDVSGSYRRALADTVEQFTDGAYRPSPWDIDALKAEGLWNNDWEASQELLYRYFEAQGRSRDAAAENAILLHYDELVAFFQSRYRGTDPTHWTGYICHEPLLVQPSYLEQLTQAGIRWGFFSGATTGSARYVLEQRLALRSPVLVAMEDAPGKPDPTGLVQTVRLLSASDATTVSATAPVIYVGDTVADMHTIVKARQLYSDRHWFAVGVLPPHVQETAANKQTYISTLQQAGAQVVYDNVQELTVGAIERLVKQERGGTL